MQIKTYEESERVYIEQMELVQQLRAENAALAQESRTIAALKAEIVDLQAKVTTSQIVTIYLLLKILPNRLAYGMLGRMRLHILDHTPILEHRAASPLTASEIAILPISFMTKLKEVWFCTLDRRDEWQHSLHCGCAKAFMQVALRKQ